MCIGAGGPVPGFVYLKQSKDGVWHLYRREGDPTLNHFQGNAPTKEPEIDWAETAAVYEASLTPALRGALAQALGVPEARLADLHTGDKADEDCWTFPEFDGKGNVVGINRRFQDGRKKAMTGSQRGLYIPDGAGDCPGPVFLVEGASDSLALISMGLAAVGRPSNTGGVDHLAELLKDLPADRPITEVGEFDPKEDGEWPGKEGAVSTATALAEKLNRPVGWALPPGRAKDVRQWASDQKLDPTITDAWHDAGGILQAALEAQLTKPGHTIKPPNRPNLFAGYEFKGITSEQFFGTDYRPTWLVKRCLVQGQPCILGGEKKALKTCFFTDLAISLASGLPFLGKLDVYRPAKVALLSGESGEYTIQNTTRRICAAKGIADPSTLPIIWDFDLPQLANPGDVAKLREALICHQIKALLLEPLYLSLLAGEHAKDVEAGNLFHMGPLLRAITKACLNVDCTPIFAHHVKKNRSGNRTDPLDLDDLAYSGTAEFARQWWLLSRREPFDPETGESKLWYSVGGSVGHGGLWAVDVCEGVLDDIFGGRKWEVIMQTASKAREQEAQAGDGKKKQKRAAQDRADDSNLLGVLKRLDPEGKGFPRNRVQAESNIPERRFVRAVSRLQAENLVKECTAKSLVGNGARRDVQGLRLVDPQNISADMFCGYVRTYISAPLCK
jgi:hypothetical protein